MQITTIERYERNQILRGLEEHLFNYWRSILLQDHKEFVEEFFSDIPSGSFDRMMYFFTSDYNNVDLENRPVAKALYEKLGWNSEYHDVINSFYTTFACSLVAYSESEEAPSFGEIHDGLNKDNKLKKIIRNWECSLFGFGDKTNLKIAMCGGLKDISKKAYANKVLEKWNLQHVILEKYFFDSSNNKVLSEKVLELTPLCHSAANFMPCPSKYEEGKKSYNQLKGILNDVRDYLPLMIDKIQQCIDKNQPLKYSVDGKEDEVSLSTIECWKNWFEDNYEKYFLEDYYVIHEENGNKKLKGKPLFKNQSLSYPIPKTKEEIEECIKNIILITNRRADSMAKRIISRMKDGATCKDIWS